MAARIIVHPPSRTGGRRVSADGTILGPAMNRRDLLEFIRRAGLDPEAVDLEDSTVIVWRGAGPDIWE
ncbi:hypothetical protein [Streptomyces benahoarensis]|uniref:Uncharacterized protein n=1 Tax=Streptomyces benahoarensis TaxID=2595054 RepID=A0A553Z775_9ACTN|nr:hypothetical protein [Streptomyces benahoarensis]TSB19297.1 hypothetical protein FNJ62_22730 [Streptomyces benahoarensis]TSB37285.1 hypothetical protein FNZ23_18665 [Streptomyces benahoarensis]